MVTVKRTISQAYIQAVIDELERRGLTHKEAVHTFRTIYRPLRQTWGLDLNPEAFADEMIKVKQQIAKLPHRTGTQKVATRIAVDPIRGGIFKHFKAKDEFAKVAESMIKTNMGDVKVILQAGKSVPSLPITRKTNR